MAVRPDPELGDLDVEPLPELVDALPPDEPDSFDPAADPVLAVVPRPGV